MRASEMYLSVCTQEACALIYACTFRARTQECTHTYKFTTLRAAHTYTNTHRNIRMLTTRHVHMHFCLAKNRTPKRISVLGNMSGHKEKNRHGTCQSPHAMKGCRAWVEGFRALIEPACSRLLAQHHCDGVTVCKAFLPVLVLVRHHNFVFI
jgi:hypothetical protein